MKPEAIIQAEGRLKKARAALQLFIETSEPAALEDLWADVIMALGGVYSKLEQGAKGSGRSNGWFGRKKHERRTDPLLSYLHQARNAEEHGLSSVTERSSSAVQIPHGTKVHLQSDGHSLKATHISGPEITAVLDRIKLVPVMDDRSGKWFAVPREHLGKPIDQSSPRAVATLVIAYLEAILAEARSL